MVLGSVLGDFTKGEKLHISSSTVKTHTLNLYGKLEVNSRVQAVAKAKELKLV